VCVSLKAGNRRNGREETFEVIMTKNFPEFKIESSDTSKRDLRKSRTKRQSENQVVRKDKLPRKDH
jgi:hypothetical protein